MQALFKSLGLEKDNEDKAVALCDAYTEKHAAVAHKLANDTRYRDDKSVPIKEWVDFAKTKEPDFDEIKKLALDKVRQLQDAFVKLKDVTFQIDRIESDAFHKDKDKDTDKDKAYPVPLFVAGSPPPPVSEDKGDASTPSGGLQ